ncbi:MAG: cyclase family protein [Desulfovibrio sp.]
MSHVWLSHPLTPDTPLYGGNGHLRMEPERDLSAGDSCNCTRLAFNSHTGTHVDAPRHFLADGKTVDQYDPEDWLFTNVGVIDVTCAPGALVTPADLPALPPNPATDMVLLRTGFEARRATPFYWKQAPALSSELLTPLLNAYPELRALGVDCLSVSCPRHRAEGHKTHKAFLGKNILLFEDMRLEGIQNRCIKSVTALPLRLFRGDGAPCTIMAELV